MVTSEGGSTPSLFADLYSDERVIVFNGFMKDIHNIVLKTLRRIHFSEKINRVVKLPFKGIWHCSLRTIDWNCNTMYYVIFVGAALRPNDCLYLENIRKKYNVKYILYALDAWSDNKRSKFAKYYMDRLGFDYIFTFDYKDAIVHNFIYINAPYSIITDNKSNNIENDLYLVANAKGRLNEFHMIYEYLEKNNVSSQYRISEVPGKQQSFKDKIIYNNPIKYTEIINELKKSNCILEVLTKRQSAATNRYYEAVCYNKKLLTNNKNVVNLPFYNPEYIHVFEKPEDIDCDWVKERIPVDYQYDGRFSPTHLIDKIIELEEQKEGKRLVEKQDF